MIGYWSTSEAPVSITYTIEFLNPNRKQCIYLLHGWYYNTCSDIVTIRVIWSKFLVCGGIHNIGPMGKLNLGCMITINMNINIILSSSLKIMENTQNKCREISAEHRKRNSKYLPRSLEMGSVNPDEFVR